MAIANRVLTVTTGLFSFVPALALAGPVEWFENDYVPTWEEDPMSSIEEGVHR